MGAGFNEILNNSLTKAAYYDDNGKEDKEDKEGDNGSDKLVRIMNPLSSDLSGMRQTLRYGGLETIAYNANRRNPNLRLFEFGNIYSHDPQRENADNPMQAYSEDYRLALWVSGKRVSGSWAHPDEDTTYHELKAYVQNIFARIGLYVSQVVFETSTNERFQKAIAIKTRAGKTIAEMGIVSRQLLIAAGIDSAVDYAVISWTAAMRAVKKNKVRYTEISKYPAVSRDLALLLDKGVEFAAIERVAYQTEKKLLRSVELFDVYEGKNLPAGKKSYAVNFILQDETKTLNDKQIDAIMNKLIANIKRELNAELR